MLPAHPPLVCPLLFPPRAFVCLLLPPLRVSDAFWGNRALGLASSWPPPGGSGQTFSPLSVLEEAWLKLVGHGFYCLTPCSHSGG